MFIDALRPTNRIIRLAKLSPEKKLAPLSAAMMLGSRRMASQGAGLVNRLVPTQSPLDTSELSAIDKLWSYQDNYLQKHLNDIIKILYGHPLKETRTFKKDQGQLLYDREICGYLIEVIGPALLGIAAGYGISQALPQLSSSFFTEHNVAPLISPAIAITVSMILRSLINEKKRPNAVGTAFLAGLSGYTFEQIIRFSAQNPIYAYALLGIIGATTGGIAADALIHKLTPKPPKSEGKLIQKKPDEKVIKNLPKAKIPKQPVTLTKKEPVKTTRKPPVAQLLAAVAGAIPAAFAGDDFYKIAQILDRIIPQNLWINPADPIAAGCGYIVFNKVTNFLDNIFGRFFFDTDNIASQFKESTYPFDLINHPMDATLSDLRPLILDLAASEWLAHRKRGISFATFIDRIDKDKFSKFFKLTPLLNVIYQLTLDQQKQVLLNPDSHKGGLLRNMKKCAGIELLLIAHSKGYNDKQHLLPNPNSLREFINHFGAIRNETISMAQSQSVSPYELLALAFPMMTRYNHLECGFVSQANPKSTKFRELFALLPYVNQRDIEIFDKLTEEQPNIETRTPIASTITFISAFLASQLKDIPVDMDSIHESTSDSARNVEKQNQAFNLRRETFTSSILAQAMDTLALFAVSSTDQIRSSIIQSLNTINTTSPLNSVADQQRVNLIYESLLASVQFTIDVGIYLNETFYGNSAILSLAISNLRSLLKTLRRY